MRKIFNTLCAAIFLFACNFLVPTAQRDENPLLTPPGPALDQTSSPTSQASDSSTEPFIIVRIKKVDGDLMTQLALETKKAKALGLPSFVEFDATWCPPCIAINNSLTAKAPLTIKAFTGIYLIRADVDEWGWGDGKNFEFEAIPIWYKLDENGEPTGDFVDGGKWNEDIPKNFAPVLDSFFHSN